MSSVVSTESRELEKYFCKKLCVKKLLSTDSHFDYVCIVTVTLPKHLFAQYVLFCGVELTSFWYKVLFELNDSPSMKSREYFLVKE